MAARTRQKGGRPIEVIANVDLVRPESGEALERVDLRLAHGRVVDVTTSRPGNRGEGTFDGAGLFAMAGLIDVHVHALGPLVGEVPGVRDLPWVFRQQARNFAAYLRAGVTTLRDMAAPLRLIRWWSRRAERFEILAPRVLYAGPMVTVPDGYPHYFGAEPAFVRWALGPLRVDLRSAAGARRTVRLLRRSGAQCVKVAYQSEQYDDARSPLPTISPSLIRALSAEGRACGLPIALHQVYLRDLRALLHVPFDSLEHCPIDAELSEADVAALAERPLTLSSTLTAYAPLDQVDEIARLLRDEPERFERQPRTFVEQMVRVLERGESPSPEFGPAMFRTGATFMRRNLRKLATAGLPVAFGTDSGLGPGLPGCPVWELRQLRRAGFSNCEALRAATVDAASTIGRPDLGRIERGTQADVVLMRANPLEDIEAVGRVAAVVRGGRLLYKAPAARAGRVRRAA